MEYKSIQLALLWEWMDVDVGMKYTLIKQKKSENNKLFGDKKSKQQLIFSSAFFSHFLNQ